ncbi:uncharacterized protein [Prorops nasuta]|uniref:uncharacterized protein n=1 Tax=Prorops nasuta TaxID=863751 RepID=UPI0034CF8D8E
MLIYKYTYKSPIPYEPIISPTVAPGPDTLGGDYQDLILLPCESYLYIEGKLIEGTRISTVTAEDTVVLDCNSMAFLFDEIRYELNGIEIDPSKNVGITSSMKILISLTGEENYRRVIINTRHELVLIGARNYTNSIYSSTKITDSKIDVQEVQWTIPHISLNEYTKLQFLQTQRHTWAVKAATLLEKPRYVIIAFRRNKKNTQHMKVLDFDDSFVQKPSKPMLNYKNFLEYGPLFVIDYSHQNESVKSGTVDVKIEIDCSKNIANFLRQLRDSKKIFCLQRDTGILHCLKLQYCYYTRIKYSDCSEGIRYIHLLENESRGSVAGERNL